MMDFSRQQIELYFRRYFPKLCASPTGQCLVRSPFRQDRNPSLSIDLRRGVWYDFGTRDGGGILDFERRKDGGTPAEVWQRICGIVGQPPDSSFPEPERIYDYMDERGTLLYQVVRLPGKRFLQRRPDGHGGWLWNLQAVRRVPYQLGEVLKAERVFILEGEKDVETLRALGLASTTNSGGAGKWRAEFGAYFRDREIAILPDNDPPGRDHAQEIATLLSAVARSVKVINLPGLTDHQDVSDWLAKDGGNTRARLLEIVDQTPPWERPAAPEESAQPKRRGTGKSEPAAVRQAEVELPDGRRAEMVAAADGSGTRFCLFRPGSEEHTFLDYLELSGRIVKPTASEWVRYKALSLPSEPDFSDVDGSGLFAGICSYLENWFAGDAPLLFVSTLYILLSWRVHMVHELPYLRVLGEPGTGKSRWLTAMSQVCYRATQPTVDITEASLFRLLKDAPDATLAIEEADRRTAYDDPVNQVLRAGFERGRYVWRSDPVGVGQAHEPQPFPCFGPKLLAATRQFRDDALESRIFSFSLPLRELPPGISAHVRPVLMVEGSRLRNRLFAYHLLTYSQGASFASRMRTWEQQLREEHLEGRAIQIGTALLTLAEEIKFPEALEACRSIVRAHSREITESRSESLDGAIFDTLNKLRGEGRTEVSLPDLHRAICDDCAERGLTRTTPEGARIEPIRSHILSRTLRKQARRFGVRIEPRRHGRDQTTISLMV
jgi:hypothetical protein